MRLLPFPSAPRPLWVLVLLATLALAACGGGDEGGDGGTTDAAGPVAATDAAPAGDGARELGVAVEGLAQLVLQDETTGERHFRRSGRLRLDADGRLMHAGVGPVLGRSQAGAAFQPLGAALTVPARATSRLRVEGSLEPLRTGEASPTWQDGSPLPPDVIEAQRVRRAFGTALQTDDGQPMHLMVSFTAAQPAEAPEAAHRWHAEAVVFNLAEGEVARAATTFQLLPSGMPDPARAAVLHLATAHPSLSPTIEVDLSGLREAPGPFTVERIEHDGRAAGRLEGVSIAADGQVTMHYDNGVALAAGQLALARFRPMVQMAGGRFVDARCGPDCETPAYVVGDPPPGVRLRVSRLDRER